MNEEFQTAQEELQALFHRLKSQLGIVLAKVLESKAADACHRGRAAQLVVSTLAAMGILRELRQRTIPFAPQSA